MNKFLSRIVFLFCAVGQVFADSPIQDGRGRGKPDKFQSKLNINEDSGSGFFDFYREVEQAGEEENVSGTPYGDGDDSDPSLDDYEEGFFASCRRHPVKTITGALTAVAIFAVGASLWKGGGNNDDQGNSGSEGSPVSGIAPEGGLKMQTTAATVEQGDN